jgi:hypothetical protein
MSAMKGYIRALFYLATLYDGFLGLAFVIAPTWALETVGVPVPYHVGFVQFPAALLIVFAIMFFVVAQRPLENRNLIPYGILLKVSYCSVVFAHWILGQLSTIWKPFAIADLVFGVLFWLAYRELGERLPASGS